MQKYVTIPFLSLKQSGMCLSLQAVDGKRLKKASSLARKGFHVMKILLACVSDTPNNAATVLMSVPRRFRIGVSRNSSNNDNFLFVVFPDAQYEVLVSEFGPLHSHILDALSFTNSKIYKSNSLLFM